MVTYHLHFFQRKAESKGPNYREPRSTNFNKAFAEITTGLDNCINLASKSKYNVLI